MKTVKVTVLRITYQLSRGLEAFITFKNSHVCHQGAIDRVQCLCLNEIVVCVHELGDIDNRRLNLPRVEMISFALIPINHIEIGF